MSILRHTGSIVDEYMHVPAIGTPPCYRHKKPLLQMIETSPKLDAADLIVSLYKKIAANWRELSPVYGKLPSRENWRFTKQLRISPSNSSPEVTLERAIARVTDECWANQIPTASGMVHASRDKHCKIDLAERKKNCYQLIELKVSSDTPLFAAIEILQYGLLYCLARTHRAEFQYNGKALLDADEVHLRVLAPIAFYDEYRDLRWLEDALTCGLDAFVTRKIADAPPITFRFDRFPDGFAWKCDDTRLRAGIRNRHGLNDREQS